MDTWLDCGQSLFLYRFSKGNAGLANFIDEWSQCDFCFTNFGVILEYLESSIRHYREGYMK